MTTKTQRLRHPRGRQDVGRPYITLETRGRVVCPGCAGMGCDICNSRGWMIDDALQVNEFPIPAREE